MILPAVLRGGGGWISVLVGGLIVAREMGVAAVAFGMTGRGIPGCH
ncbi:MAG: hypothetical protein NTX84_03560 [Nitrospirae bacterium]|nr:hypothetical protein [Nitrospirota bacterium]